MFVSLEEERTYMHPVNMWYKVATQKPYLLIHI